MVIVDVPLDLSCTVNYWVLLAEPLYEVTQNNCKVSQNDCKATKDMQHDHKRPENHKDKKQQDWQNDQWETKRLQRTNKQTNKKNLHIES